MPVVEELFEGRSETLADKSSADIAYVVYDAADEDEVKNAAIAGTPLVYSGMTRKSIEITERVNASTWKVTVRYEGTDSEQEGEEPEPLFSFDTGGGTQHITQSIETRNKYGPEASDEFGGAIGFDGENIAGVDITVPVYNFSETHYLPASVVTQAFRMVLFRATGTVNSSQFRGFEAGEVLFLGASGSRKGENPEDDWEISFKFAANSNRNDITVGDIGPIVKQGWDYLWVQYAPDVDDEKMVLVKRPIAAYVEKVYSESDFSKLGIGV